MNPKKASILQLLRYLRGKASVLPCFDPDEWEALEAKLVKAGVLRESNGQIFDREG